MRIPTLEELEAQLKAHQRAQPAVVRRCHLSGSMDCAAVLVGGKAVAHFWTRGEAKRWAMAQMLAR